MNTLVTTASEKGAETTIKIWIADIVLSQSISKSEIDPAFTILSHPCHYKGYADQITVSNSSKDVLQALTRF